MSNFNYSLFMTIKDISNHDDQINVQLNDEAPKKLPKPKLVTTKWQFAYLRFSNIASDSVKYRGKLGLQHEMKYEWISSRAIKSVCEGGKEFQVY